MNARNIPWRRWIPWLVAVLVVLLVVALVLPAIQQAREAARRSQSKNNLKQLAISFHTYHETYSVFPPGGTFGEDGTAFHGWAPILLPYIESSSLPALIDFEAPWEAPHNSYIFKIDVLIFRSLNISSKSSSEGFTPCHYIANQNLFHRNSSSSFEDMPSGLAHHWLLTDQFQDWWPWGSPHNWGSLEWPRHGAFGENAWSGGVAMLLLADGSVETFGPNSDPSILQAYRNSPVLPAPEAIAKASNDFQFKSPPWVWRSLQLKNKSDDTYCRVLLTPSNTVDTAYIEFDNGDAGTEINVDDVKYILDEYPEIATLSLDIVLDDEVLNELLRNQN